MTQEQQLNQDDRILSIEEARQWLDDFLVEQQEEE